jgi:hypothetical protein
MLQVLRANCNNSKPRGLVKPMESSASYWIIEEMLRQNELQMEVSEFEVFVEFLRCEEPITLMEQKGLLALTRRMHLDKGA